MFFKLNISGANTHFQLLSTDKHIHWFGEIKIIMGEKCYKIYTRSLDTIMLQEPKEVNSG